MIQHFPEWFYLVLREFLYDNEYSQVCNTSKQYFQTIKKLSIRYYLNYRYSCYYFKDAQFQDLLHSKITSPRFQIGLKFMYIIQHVPPNAVLKNLYQLRCNVQLTEEQVLRLQDITDIELMNISTIHRFPAIPGCQSLTLRNFQNLETVLSSSTSSFSFSSSSSSSSSPAASHYHCHHHHHLQRVLLDACSNFNDARCLAKVSELTFIRCPLLEDLSSLGKHQRKINITECPLVSNVSSLGNVKTLRIRYCPLVTEVSALGGVPHLELIGCPLISNISPLTQNYFLTVDGCNFLLLGYSSAFANIAILRLSGCSIEDLAVFHHLHSIELSFCPLVVDVSPLADVYQVVLRSCECVLEVNSLGNVPSLSLIRCDNLSDIRGLGQNAYVKISYCSKIVDYSSLSSVPVVEINNHSLQSALALQQQQQL